MSLRFDRKATSKLRASFSVRSRTEKERDEAAEKNQSQEEFLKNWSYRQCQFACDYLNLIETPTLKPNLSKAKPESCVDSGQDASSSKENTADSNGSGESMKNSSLNPNEGSFLRESCTSKSKLSGNMSSASLGSTLSIPASCITTSSRSSFNSSVLSTVSSASSNHSSDSSSSCGGASESLYADLFELGYGSSSLIFRVSFRFFLYNEGNESWRQYAMKWLTSYAVIIVLLIILMMT